MSCKRCGSERMASICAESSGLNSGTIEGKKFDGYMPRDIGIGGGDYVDFSYCLNCGQIVGDFPIERKPEEDEDLF